VLRNASLHCSSGVVQTGPLKVKETPAQLAHSQSALFNDADPRNARNLPTAAERARALRNVELHAGLARALDADPDRGMAKSLKAPRMR
jgi:hypothetical protein